MTRNKGKKAGYFVVDRREGFTGYVATDTTNTISEMWTTLDKAIGGETGYRQGFKTLGIATELQLQKK